MKKVMRCLYVHKTAFEQLPMEAQALVFLNQSKANESAFKNYTIIKVDMKTEAVSFIMSDDWDTANEPSVGNSMCCKADGTVKLSMAKGQIYHHKWEFVAYDYKGFNVEESKTRSYLWKKTIAMDKGMYCKIGYRKYWNILLEEYNLPI